MLGRLFAFNPFRSLTFVGFLVALASTLMGHFDAAALTPTGVIVLQAVGSVLTVIGIRNLGERVLQAARSTSPSATGGIPEPPRYRSTALPQ